VELKAAYKAAELKNQNFDSINPDNSEEILQKKKELIADLATKILMQTKINERLTAKQDAYTELHKDANKTVSQYNEDVDPFIVLNDSKKKIELRVEAHQA
jgi:transposase